MKLSYDLWYIKNTTICTDLMILLQTCEVVIWGRGTSMAGNGDANHRGPVPAQALTGQQAEGEPLAAGPAVRPSPSQPKSDAA
jgi:hypothetical protein